MVGLGSSHEEAAESLRVGKRIKHTTLPEAIESAHRYREGKQKGI
jgi:hypothetical protein